LRGGLPPSGRWQMCELFLLPLSHLRSARTCLCAVRGAILRGAQNRQVPARGGGGKAAVPWKMLPALCGSIVMWRGEVCEGACPPRGDGRCVNSFCCLYPISGLPELAFAPWGGLNFARCAKPASSDARRDGNRERGNCFFGNIVSAWCMCYNSFERKQQNGGKAKWKAKRSVCPCTLRRRTALL